MTRTAWRTRITKSVLLFIFTSSKRMIQIFQLALPLLLQCSVLMLLRSKSIRAALYIGVKRSVRTEHRTSDHSVRAALYLLGLGEVD
jgi:hypothetical protein